MILSLQKSRRIGFDKERDILSPKSQDYLSKNQGISKYKTETPHEGKVCNFDCTDFLLDLLHPFANLIIGEAASTLLPNSPFFLQVHIALLVKPEKILIF